MANFLAFLVRLYCLVLLELSKFNALDVDMLYACKVNIVYAICKVNWSL